MKNWLRKLLLFALSMVIFAMLPGGQPHHTQAAPPQTSHFNYGLIFQHSSLENLCPGMAVTINVYIRDMVTSEHTIDGKTTRNVTPHEVVVRSAEISVMGSTHGSITQGEGTDLLGALRTFTYLAVEPGKDTLRFSAEIVNPDTSQRKYADRSLEIEVKDCAYEVVLVYQGSMSSGPGHFKMLGYTDSVWLRPTGSGSGVFTTDAPFVFKMALTVPDCSIHIGEATSTAHFIGKENAEALDLTVTFESVNLTATGTCPNGSATVSFPWDLSILGPTRFEIDFESLNKPLARFFMPADTHTVSDPGISAYSGDFTMFAKRVAR
jgi:hypothetical protein